MLPDVAVGSLAGAEDLPPGERGQQGEVAGEALFQPHLQGVVHRVGNGGGVDGHAAAGVAGGELGVVRHGLPARNGAGVVVDRGGVGDGGHERIGHLVVERRTGPGDGVHGHLVEVVVAQLVQAAAADVGRGDDPRTREFVLQAEVPVVGVLSGL